MDEKMRILKMVEDGKLSAEQAAGLIAALEGSGAEDGVVQYAEASGSRASAVPYEKRMLRVIVDSPKGDKVNIRLPVKIIRQVLKVTGKLPIKGKELQGIDLDALATAVLECLDSEMLGNIVEVDSEDGTMVRVFIG